MIVLSHTADRAADAQAAEAGIADFLLVPGLSPDRLEHAIRYAITHQRKLQRLAASEERHALALRGANDGLWDWDVEADRVFYSPRWKSMLGYRELEVGEMRGEWLGRVHADDRSALTQALDAYLGGASAETFEFEHRMQHRDGSYRWMLARGIAVRDERGRATPRRRQRDRRHRAGASPSSACSTTRCTTRSPACPTACCSSTASTTRSAAPSATTRSAAPRCSSSTWTASRSSTTRSATRAATSCCRPSRGGSRRRCGPTTPSPA